MSRSYTSSPPCASTRVLWDCFTFYLFYLVAYFVVCILVGFQRVCLSAMAVRHQPFKPNVVVEWLTLLFRIWMVAGSNLDLETSYSDRDFSLFSSAPPVQANSGLVL
jgi:hypothetical protein